MAKRASDRGSVVHLDDEQTQLVLQHVLRVHAVEEEKRRRLEQCTHLAELRETLLECGLPVDDIDKALRDVPLLLQRRRQIRRGIAVALTLTALAAALIVFRPQPPPPLPRTPLAFVSLETRFNNDATTFTWQDRLTSNGSFELLVAEKLRNDGYPVVEELTAPQRDALFPKGQTVPSLAAIKAETRATLAVLGNVRCFTLPDEVFHTKLLSGRCSLVLKLVNVETGQSVGSAQMDRGSMALDAHMAMTNAFKETLNHWEQVDALIELPGSPQQIIDSTPARAFVSITASDRDTKDLVEGGIERVFRDASYEIIANKDDANYALVGQLACAKRCTIRATLSGAGDMKLEATGKTARDALESFKGKLEEAME